MRTRLRLAWGLLALALLAATCAPGALADHTYTHRYLATGRVVDAEGFPLANVTLRLYIDSGTPVGSQGQTERAIRLHVTDCNGDFGWNIRDEAYINPSTGNSSHAYLHVHEPSTRGALFVDAIETPYNLTGPYTSESALFRQISPFFDETIPVLASAVTPIDPFARESRLLLALNETRPDLRCEGAEAKGAYTVTGRVMQAIPRQSRDGGGIVISEPILDTPVTVTLGGATETVTTDSEGHFTARLAAPASLEGALVGVTWNGTTTALPAEPLHRSTTVFLRSPAHALPDARFTATPQNLTVHVAAEDAINRITWDWGDGSPADGGATANHTYRAPGAYLVRMYAQDTAGAVNTSARVVTVPATGGSPTDTEGQNQTPPAEPGNGTPAAGPVAALLALAGVALVAARRRL